MLVKKKCCCPTCPDTFTLTIDGVTICAGCLTGGGLTPGTSLEMLSVGVNTEFTIPGPVAPTIVAGEERCVHQPTHTLTYPDSWLSWNIHDDLTCTDPTPTVFNSLNLKTIVHVRKSDGKIRLVQLIATDLGNEPVFESGTVTANEGDAIANTLACFSYPGGLVSGGTATVTFGV
jgi:hypothetical protein